MNIIEVLTKNMLLELPTSLLFAIFMYKTLMPEYKAKYGIVGTPILYAISSSLIRVILDQWLLGLNDQLHTLMMCCYLYIVTLCMFNGKRKKIILKTTIVIVVEVLIECLVGGITYFILQINIFSIRSSYYIACVGKITFFPIMHIYFVVWDMWRQKNEERLVRYITAINFVIGLIQFFMLIGTIKRYRNIFEDNAYILTVISNIVLLVGYFVITEVFGEISRQEQKERELGKIKISQQYQYDSYQFAQKQGEEIRDIRHDLRNQIQIVQYLAKSGENKAGREMLVNLKKKVNDLDF